MTALSPAPAPIWTDAEPLVCIAVRPETPDVKTFVFRASSGARFAFLAGQHVTLDLPLPAGPVQRSFSIASSPTAASAIDLTVKAQPASSGARWMHDHLRPGQLLRATGPAGRFHLPQAPDGKYLFIAAGSGITPIMAMIRRLCAPGKPVDISLILCARRPADLIFRKPLEALARAHAGLRLHFVVAQDAPCDGWTGYRGRFAPVLLGLTTPDVLCREIYCCGPQGFMDRVRGALQDLGHDRARYHQESFGPATATLPPPAPAPGDDGLAQVCFALSQKTLRADPGQTILQLAKAAGLTIPSGCQFGLCGTCKIRKLAGRVEMQHQGGISEDEIAQGDILACCSRPCGPVSVAV